VARDSNGSFTANAGTFTTLSGNLTGNVTLTTGTITTNAANATDITNKAYVDGLFSTSISYHEPVQYEVANTQGNLNAVYVQPNGAGNGVSATLTNNGANAAFVADGIVPTTGDRILVYNQTNGFENGIYEVTTVGAPDSPGPGAKWVLTRTTDADTYGVGTPNALGQGDAFFVQGGNTAAGETYVVTTQGTITFGTTNITFAQISSSQIYAAGTGLNLSNLTFSVANTAVTAATYGNDGAVPQIAVNAQGQITSASNVSINASSISVGTLANGRTTAASANGASTIVARDSDGSFTANVVTAGTGSFTAVSGNGIALTAINASNIASGTIANARTTAATANGASTIVLRGTSGEFTAGAITGSSFTGDGSALSAINASNVSSGTIGTARLASGTANSSTYLRGDQTWATVAAGGLTLTNDTTTNATYYPTITTATSGSISAANVSSSKLFFNPSTGTLTATVMSANSDERLKENWTDVDPDFVSKLAKVKHGVFSRKDSGNREPGVGAQSFMPVLPEAVVEGADGYLSVNYGGAALVSAIELAKVIEDLRAEVKELKAEVDALKG
jgi:hypothetical protein